MVTKTIKQFDTLAFLGEDWSDRDWAWLQECRWTESDIHEILCAVQGMLDGWGCYPPHPESIGAYFLALSRTNDPEIVDEARNNYRRLAEIFLDVKTEQQR